MNKENITIINPGRLGDIIIVLPIAYHYFLKGYNIIWPVCSEYIDIFRNINFDIFNPNIGSINRPVKEIVEKAKTFIDKEFLDLAIGFGNNRLNEKWYKTGLSFDIWKYKESNVDYQEKYKLFEFVKRNREKEEELAEFYNIDKNYVIAHEFGSHRRYFDFGKVFDFADKKIIKVERKENYNLFDWLSILINSNAIYCVDSCIANLVDQFIIYPPEGKFFHPWNEYYSPVQLKRLTPKINNSWKIIKLL